MKGGVRMRFNIELLLQNEMIPKDKNRLVLSMLKSFYGTYSQEYFKTLYKDEPNKVKDFTFSLYLKECRFLKDEIIIPSKKIILNFSTYNYEDGIMFYNSFLSNKHKKHPINNNIFSIGKISMVKEKTIFDNHVVFKTMSPIVVREHHGDNKKTWYHSLISNQGKAVFMDNLRHQLEDVFGERTIPDLKNMDIDIPQDCKEVKVKNYGIEVLSNIVKLRIKAQPYILDYLYKAGIGSKRGSGFGMVDIV